MRRGDQVWFEDQQATLLELYVSVAKIRCADGLIVFTPIACLRPVIEITEYPAHLLIHEADGSCRVAQTPFQRFVARGSSTDLN